MRADRELAAWLLAGAVAMMKRSMSNSEILEVFSNKNLLILLNKAGVVE